MIDIKALEKVPDIDLLLACRDGDLDAFATLYARHAPTVLRYAWSQLGDRTLAEDILQETFVTAWAKRRVAIVVDLSFLPWLLSICRNHARNQIRKNERTRAVHLDDAAGVPSDGDEQLAWIYEALAALSAEDRRICELCLVQGLSYREAAELVGSTPAAVGKRLQRSRARLRHFFESSE